MKQPREIKFGKLTLVDPGPDVPMEQVKKMYAAQHPALNTAGIKELPAGPNGVQRFEFTTQVGTNG